MKTLNLGLRLFVTLGGLAILANAEQSDRTAPPVAEPQWNNEVMWLNNGELIPLEKSKPAMKSKIKVFTLIYNKADAVAVFPGNTSSVVVPPTAEFVVKMNNVDGENPATFIDLNKLERGKKQREIVVATYTDATTSESTKRIDKALPVKFEPYGKDSIKIIPGGLPPGEYCISLDTNPGKEGLFYLFRVDGNNKPQPGEP